MLYSGPWLELLGSDQFNGVQWKWLQSFAVVSIATSRIWRAYLWPLFAFSVCQCFTGPSKGNFFVIARSASKALSEVGLCSCFIVGICINFFVSSCTHLSFACFLRLFTFCLVFYLSSCFLDSLVGFGYLAFTQRQTFLGVFLLFLPLPCCLFYLFFVASFLFVYGLLRSWNWLISAIVSYPPICVLYYGVVHMHVSFVCYCFSRVDLRLHNSERILLPRGRVCFVYLCFSALRSLQGIVANGPRSQRPGKP